MKLNVDFSSLWDCVNRMGAERTEFEWVLDQGGPEIDFGDLLGTKGGVEIGLEDLEIINGLLSVKGFQVLLFIPDHDLNISAVLNGESEKGKRFHVADCQTLERMRREKRFERYKVTNNLSGNFHIYGKDSVTRRDIEGEARLIICRYCLNYLNYKDYKKTKSSRNAVVEHFDISEFFATYSSLFRKLPEHNGFLTGSGYSDDWRQISLAYRKSRRFVCEHCQVNLADYNGLLHTHHINGNKRDNREVNLQALCVDCHRKEPLHHHMHVKHRDMQLINQLRRKQSLLKNVNWDNVFDLADPAVHGLLLYYRNRKTSAPEVGYEVVDSNQAVVAQLELAWPSHKKGIAIDVNDLNSAQAAGWKVILIGQAIRLMNQRGTFET